MSISNGKGSNNEPWAIGLIKPGIHVEAIEPFAGPRFISIVFRTQNGEVEVMIEVGTAYAFAMALEEIANVAAHAPRTSRALTVVAPAKATEVFEPVG